MAAEADPPKTKEKINAQESPGPPIRVTAGEVAVYTVVVERARYAPAATSDAAESIADERLIEMLREVEPKLTRRLEAATHEVLGNQFEVEIRAIRPAQSVVIVVAVTAIAAATLSDPVSELLAELSGRMASAVLAALSALSAVADVYAPWDQVADSSPSEAAKPWESVGTVLATIGTGIGALGFVTFAGGAVEYARMRAAGLPAAEALAVVPKPNLVVIGAETLVPAIALALVGTTCFYIWHVVSNAEGAPGPNLPKLSPLTRAKGVAGVLVFFEMLGPILGYDGLGFLQIACLVILAILTAALTFHFALTQESFPWLGAVMLVSLGIFYAALGYACATGTEHNVRPAAVIRNNDRAVIGFFIAQTSDQVYLARLEFPKTPGEFDTGSKKFDKGKSRVIAIDADEVTDLSVGPLMNPPEAVTRAHVMAEELCDLQIPRAEREAGPDKPGADKTPDCWEARKAGERPPP